MTKSLAALWIFLPKDQREKNADTHTQERPSPRCGVAPGGGASAREGGMSHAVLVAKEACRMRCMLQEACQKIAANSIWSRARSGMSVRHQQWHEHAMCGICKA